MLELAAWLAQALSCRVVRGIRLKMKYLSIAQLEQRGGIGPYKKRHQILQLIQEGTLQAIVRTGKKGQGKRYYIPEVAIQEAQKLIIKPFISKDKDSGRVSE